MISSLEILFLTDCVWLQDHATLPWQQNSTPSQHYYASFIALDDIPTGAFSYRPRDLHIYTSFTFISFPLAVDLMDLIDCVYILVQG